MQITSLLFFLFVAIGPALAQTGHLGYARKSPNKVVVTDTESQKILSQVASGNAYLIDVRTPEEFAEKHLKHARNINIRSAEFGNEIAQLDKRKPVYLYCRSGNRSGKATDSLLTLGYQHVYNIGGLDSLTKAGLPLEK